MSRLEPSFQLPEQMSTVAAQVDFLYNFIFWLSVVLFVGIVGAMVYFVSKYRKRPGHKATPTGHNLVLEIGWTLAPIPILALLFHWGFQSYLDQAVAPVDSIEIRVRGTQWNWEFEYPGGATDTTLHVPVNRNVKLVMSSGDVLHAFFVPELRLKKDLVPGMFTSVWFRATKEGEMDLLCAEYCGAKSNPDGKDYKGHSNMVTKVISESQDKYDAYVLSKAPARTPEARGEQLYKNKGCAGCHTIDGTRTAGPSWKGIFGRPTALVGGAKVNADENYLRESILQPGAKVVDGFANVMPPYQGQLSDAEVDALIAYMKTLK